MITRDATTVWVCIKEAAAIIANETAKVIANINISLSSVNFMYVI
jgi:hypothetical protein